MTYTEIQLRNSNKYYYRVRSIRKGNKITKKKIYLGANLDKKLLSAKEVESDKELVLLNNLLTKKESDFLKELKKDYLSNPKETFENRYEAFCSLFTYDSTAIEGNTINLQQTSQLLFENLTPNSKSLREVNEILNHKKALDYLLSYNKDINKKLILELHTLIVKDTLKKELDNQIGKYRELQVYIRGVDWTPPKPKEVPQEMKSLLTWYSKNKTKLHPLILATYFHVRFEVTHPFVDGNGRVGRLLMNFILHKNKYPMINILNSRKYEYYNALQKAQDDGNLRPFVELLLSLLKEAKILF